MRAAFFALLAFPLSAFAQNGATDPLTATLPSGRVVHFETAEQKARFEAARDRAAQTVIAQPSPTPAAQPGGASSPSDPYALPDTKVTLSGIANTSAPVFTADYYMGAPETWLGKTLTVSAATLRATADGPDKDGLRELNAYTYNQGSHGGNLRVLAPPDVALRLMKLVGSTFQYNFSGYKTTLFKGVLRQDDSGRKRYYLYVEK